MPDRIHLGSPEELQPGDRKIVDIDGREVCVFNYEGEYYGILNHCPHFGGEVGKGEILPEVTVEEQGPGRMPEEVYSDRVVIVCPWHGWEFDIESGEHAGDSSVSVPTYDIVVEDGQLYLER